MIQEMLSLLLSVTLPLGAVYAPAGSLPDSVTQAAAPAALSAPAFEDFDAAFDIREQNPVSDEFLAAVDEFSAQTAAGLLTGAENACYSPASLYFALALTASGAAGDTQSQLLDLLGAEDAASLTQSCSNLYRLLYTDNEIGALQIANALWMEETAAFMPDFTQTASSDFYAWLYTADLNAPATVTAMEQWVSEHTGGKIQPIIEPSADSILYLMNTIYLKDEWTDLFDETENTVEPFYLADGSSQNATYMHREDIGSFVRADGYLSASLGLKNLGWVTFVLPDEDTPLSSLLTRESLAAILSDENAVSSGRILWSVPKFTYDSKLDLKAMLQGCGVTDLFDAERADLSAMTTAQPAYLASATQQTYIDVNEKGVEAAAYTELGYAGSSLPEGTAEMKLDRPFLYILTASNGTPLFIGVCAQPTAA